MPFRKYWSEKRSRRHQDTLTIEDAPRHPPPAVLQLDTLSSDLKPISHLSLASLDSFSSAPEHVVSLECRYLSLPAELHLEILSHLQYPEFQSLRRTCSFFRGFIETPALEASQQTWKTAMHHKELNGDFLTGQRLPCYHCAELLPLKRFPDRHRATMDNISTMNRTADRACLRCIWPIAKRGEPIWIDGKAWGYCRLCKRSRPAFGFRERTKEKCYCKVCGSLLLPLRIWQRICLRDMFLLFYLLIMGVLSPALFVYGCWAKAHGRITGDTIGWLATAAIVQEGGVCGVFLYRVRTKKPYSYTVIVLLAAYAGILLNTGWWVTEAGADGLFLKVGGLIEALLPWAGAAVWLTCGILYCAWMCAGKCVKCISRK